MIKIGTRASELALWQAHHVKDILEKDYGQSTEIVKISTKGDEIQDRSLIEIGGKGLFLKEIEEQLLDHKIDIAVHSMKDVPHELPNGLTLAAILERGDPFDAFVSENYQSFNDLPQKAKVGSCSLRRVEQLKEKRPDLEFLDLRGNVNTRLKKLQEGQFDAIILACAGLKRLGLQKHIREVLPIVPAVGQGAVGVECRQDDTDLLTLIQKLNHPLTVECVNLERYFLKQVEGDCKTPIGCYVVPKADQVDIFELQIFYANAKNHKHLFEVSDVEKSLIVEEIDRVVEGVLSSYE